MIQHFIVLLLGISPVFSNTEKTTVVGPKIFVPLNRHIALGHINLKVLSPHHTPFRTHIKSTFPNDLSKIGRTSWFIMGDLIEGQKYEVRICWAATQPTTFRIKTHELHRYSDIPKLVTEMMKSGDVRNSDPQVAFFHTNLTSSTAPDQDRELSTVLLQLDAAADYYTWNKELMQEVPQVHADIIVDPYILNIFPQSLLLTLVYISLLSIGSCLFSTMVVGMLEGISRKSIKSEKYL
ncbi:BgTH12-01180 [Blumeria graminis f. sp. triticale]|uniref:BgTH12-01180 n=1 Tax=Blumeria graminis f. sp. triticale TaxID=1689686 RepID=A0A9W4D6D8_BLUGR|nr:BgTH12-01180 [Blumeria graminis f. sp. triticale]